MSTPRPAGLVRDRSARLAAAERRIAAVTRVLDDLFTVPGTNRRAGIEPIVGLLPGAGDLISAAVGVWLIGEAARFRLPRIVVARMVFNTLLDLAVGAIPILGDLFDFAFKSNTRNLELFRRHAADPGASTGGQRAFFLGLVLVVGGGLWLVASAIARLLSTEVSLP